MTIARVAGVDGEDGRRRMIREKTRGHVAMALFALLIAGSFSLGDRAAPHISPTALNAVRFFLAVLLMGVVAVVASRGRGGVFRGLGRGGVFRFGVLGALMGAYFVTMFVSLRLSEPVSTSAVFTLVPIMSAVFAFLFLGQRMRIAALAGSLVAAAGAVWVIFRGDPAAIAAFDIGRGEAIYFFGCAAHAAYAPLVTRFNRDTPVTV
ncbi:MAG: DMT family transporter, partial [Pseudomonadota bacterium]